MPDAAIGRGRPAAAGSTVRVESSTGRVAPELGGFGLIIGPIRSFLKRTAPIVTCAGAPDIRPMPPRRDYFAFLTAASGFQHTTVLSSLRAVPKLPS